MQKELLILLSIFALAMLLTAIMLWPREPKKKVDRELVKYWKDAEFKDSTFKGYDSYLNQNKLKDAKKKYYLLTYCNAKGLIDENSYKEQIDQIQTKLDEVEEELKKEKKRWLIGR